MVMFMICGLFSRLQYPYAQFPCLSVTCDLLYQPFWHEFYKLERMTFKVIKLLLYCVVVINCFFLLCHRLLLLHLKVPLLIVV